MAWCRPKDVLVAYQVFVVAHCGLPVPHLTPAGAVLPVRAELLGVRGPEPAKIRATQGDDPDRLETLALSTSLQGRLRPAMRGEEVS